MPSPHRASSPLHLVEPARLRGAVIPWPDIRECSKALRYGRSGFAVNRVAAPSERSNDRTSAGSAHEVDRGANLRCHTSFSERTSLVHPLCFVGRQTRHWTLLWRAPIGVDGVDVGEDQ